MARWRTNGAFFPLLLPYSIAQSRCYVSLNLRGTEILDVSLSRVKFTASCYTSVKSFARTDIVYTWVAQSDCTTDCWEYSCLFNNVTIQYNIENKYGYVHRYKSFNFNSTIRNVLYSVQTFLSNYNSIRQVECDVMQQWICDVMLAGFFYSNATSLLRWATIPDKLHPFPR
jgi:hypothetical protein